MPVTLGWYWFWQGDLKTPGKGSGLAIRIGNYNIERLLGGILRNGEGEGDLSFSIYRDVGWREGITTLLEKGYLCTLQEPIATNNNIPYC